ncbi:hypothetical protein KC345_g11331, partial [Hortaea werneckii]
KSAAITLMALIALTVLLLNIGLSIALRLGSFQTDKMAELHVPDFLAYYKDGTYTGEIKALAGQFPGVTYTEDESALLLTARKLKYGDSEVLSALLALRADEQRTLSPFVAMGDYTPPAGANVIYLPYMFQLSGGYQTGDSFTIPGEKEPYSFVVGGFFEEALLGTFTGVAVKVFLSDPAYELLNQELGPEARYRFLSTMLTNPAESAGKLSQQVSERLAATDDSGGYMAMDAPSVLEGNRFLVNMLAVILVVFALLMVLIALIVIRFQILVQIEDYMVNIGVLKAIGYTSGQIRHSILLQFTWVTLAAALPGLFLSAAVMPLAGNLISSSLGLLWPASFDALSAAISLAAVIALVLLVIITGLTFSSIFCLILNFNMSRDNTAVIRLVGVERSSVKLTQREGGISNGTVKELSAMNGVQKLTLLDIREATVQDTNVQLQVSDDFAKLETQTVYRGRHPLYENEIALSGLVARHAGKTTGDEIAVTVNGTTRNYLITGLSQQITQLGMVASMTEAGYRRLVPDFVPKEINLYLDKSIEPAVFAKEVEARYPGVWDILNVEEWLEGTLDTFTSAVSAITWTITVVTLLVVSLILYLVIKTLILKRKQEFGILKGIGYTSVQLMTQIAFSLLPVIITGVMTGCVLGYFYSDTLFTLLLSS